MKKVLAAVIFTLIGCAVYAQKAPIKFGNVSIDDLKMSQYEKDTSAAAVVLCDYGTSTITYNQSTSDWKLTFERIKRIKVFKKQGYAQADFEVVLYHNVTDEEKISGLKVVTHNLENGKDKETKMNSDAVFKEKYDQNIDLVKFTAPNVKEGSIIEVTYRIDSEFIHYFRDWEFQSTIPVVWSEYIANVPEYFNYEKYMQGYITIDIVETKANPRSIIFTTKERVTNRGVAERTNFSTDEVKYTEDSFRWAAKDVPAFKEEPFMTTYADYISKINFELATLRFPNQPIKPIMGSWADLNRSFLESEYFGKAVKGSGFLQKTTEEVTAGMTSPEAKIAAIYNYVKTNIEWNGNNRKYTTNSFKKLLEEKKGNSAEINLLLVAMLQRAGFTANPVLLSTRKNGFVRENMAVSSQFNYVICQVLVDNKNLLLDATDRMLPINLLPERCLNGRGYIISETMPGWVSLSAPKSKTYASADLNLSTAGELKGKITITNDGYEGYALRKNYFKKGEADYLKDFSHSSSWEIEKSSFENMKNISESAKEQYEFTHTENFGDASVLYINPLIYLRMAENPFKLEDRAYPVDFGRATEKTFQGKILIPEGYTVEELPQPKIVSLPNNGGKFTYNVQVLGNTISIINIVSVNQSLFAQTEYASLREFHNIIVAKHAEQIVLKKK